MLFQYTMSVFPLPQKAMTNAYPRILHSSIPWPLEIYAGIFNHILNVHPPDGIVHSAGDIRYKSVLAGLLPDVVNIFKHPSPDNWLVLSIPKIVGSVDGIVRLWLLPYVPLLVPSTLKL